MITFEVYKIMKKIIALLFLFVGLNCFSQFSKTHYIPPLSNSNAQEPQNQFLYISSPSNTPVNFKIIALGGDVTKGTVTKDAPFVFKIGFGFDTQLMINSSNVSQIMRNKGYIIEAEDLVYVNIRLTTTPDHYQGGGIVSKGLAALGNEFRVGALLNTGIPNTDQNHYTFATVLATENNTLVTFEVTKPGVQLINNMIIGNGPPSITLNSGESYSIAVQGPNPANADGLIGALIKSDKPVAVNCGSIAGTNGDAQNLDLGFDQIVSSKNIGKEYIFIKGNGLTITERPLIVAHFPNTDIYLNDSLTPFATLQPGEYLALDGTNFSSNRSLYVRTTQDVFAYQSIGGSDSQANQNMCFVPPLSCPTPKVIDNIPLINSIGELTGFTATVNIVTKAGAVVELGLNGTIYPLPSTTFPTGIQMQGPTAVVGNPAYVSYTITGLQGNISVYSTQQVYLSYFGSSGAATYGGYYSGFTVAPEISFTNAVTATSNCIPNIELSVNSLTAYDDFQWYFNNNPIPGATGRTYTPSAVPGGFGPGLYYVQAKILECGIMEVSDTIPVSSCAQDTDNDGINDNIDIDLDNDGISNCTQSYGNVSIDWSASSTNKIEVPNYSNPYTSAITGSGTQTAQPITGFADGSFVTSTSTGLNNSVTSTINFSNPISLSLQYVDTANPNNFLSSNGDFTLQVPVNNTITVINPDDQLLIDTNYDGIYESGVTEYTSFEIRFRINGGVPLVAGTGTFDFRSRLVTRLQYTHKNLSDDFPNNATFKLIASCLPKDTDGDGVLDELDLDSDNDGIPDAVEALGQNFEVFAFVDMNTNGMNDIFEPGLILDTDGDGVPDYIDLDSDNDGIYDVVESGSNAIDSDNNGRIDGLPNSFGPNGLSDSVETASESGILNYVVVDSDGIDGIQDYIDLDSDSDTCFDVSEANFSDGDFDGILGSSPVAVDSNGVVTSATDGYTMPSNPNYRIALYANPVIMATQCDRNTTDSAVDYEFDTSGIDALLLNGQTNIDITYFDSSGNPLSSPLPNPFLTETQTIKARLTNNNTISMTTACFAETTVQFTVDRQPYIANAVSKIDYCDDLPNNRDGITVFPTAMLESSLLGSQTGFIFRYFAADGTELQLPITISSQDVTVNIENPSTQCSVSTIVSFIVNPLPDIDEVNEVPIPLCLNTNQRITLDAGLLSGLSIDYSYEWSRNSVIVPGGINYYLTVDEDGTYTVKVTNRITGCFRIRTHTIFYSEIAVIPDVVVVDLETNNTVNIEATGIGVYEYSIDNPYGPFQASPLFTNVLPGIHTVYVNDINGCGSASKEISVVGAPRFFTPNGDSYNDTWKISGVNPAFYPKSIVYIFDRYGKLIKEITNGADIGWDGTFNGKPLPGDDYWYVLKLDDGRTAKGHFALKR